jgi:uncharacterized protein (DUF3820 family)
MNAILQDSDLCPCGKYDLTRMEDVPASYLLFWEQQDDCPPAVLAYIEWARSALVAEVKHGAKLW